MEAWDIALFRAINGLAGKFPLLDFLGRLLVNDFLITTLLGLSLVILWFEGRTLLERETNQLGVAHGMLTVGISAVLLKVVNWNFYRLRPFATLDGVRMLFYAPSDSSLPSNPATVAFSVAFALWFWNRRLGTATTVLAVLLGLARIFAGVHYPADILAGAFLGAVSALAARGGITVLQPLLRRLLQILRLFAVA